MTKDEFLVMMQQNIGSYLPEHIREGCTVEIVEVMKTNDIIYKGLTFDRGDGVPCPTFYIDTAYENYCNGVPSDEIMKDLAVTIEESWDIDLPITDLDMAYDNIKGKLGFQLIDGIENRERLKSCIHTKMGNDLAMVYHIEFMQDDGFMRAVITNDMANDMNYDVEQLKADAQKNMEKIHPATLLSSPSVMMEILNGNEPVNLLEKEGLDLDSIMYVLTNKDCTFGASAIMYDGIQEKLGNMIKGNYYVIPSSTQEVMIVPVNVGPSAREILSVLREGNENFVSKDEFLSNRLFMYDRGEGILAEVKVPNREVDMER